MNLGVRNTVLIEFEALADLDVGVLQTVAVLFPNEPDMFYDLLELGDRILKGLVHDNEDINPLRILTFQENYDRADELYDIIMKDHIEEVLKYTPCTNLINFCKRSLDTKGLCNVSIICRNHVYEDILNKIFSKQNDDHYSVIYHDYITPFDISEYDCLFLRWLLNINDYTDTSGKTVYIQECILNIDVKSYRLATGIFPNLGIMAIKESNTRFRVYAPYDYDQTYFINMDYPFDDQTEILLIEPENDDEDETFEIDVPVPYEFSTHMSDAELGTVYDNTNNILSEEEPDINIPLLKELLGENF